MWNISDFDFLETAFKIIWYGFRFSQIFFIIFENFQSACWKPVGWVKPITLIDIMIEVKNFINHLCEANLDKFYLKRRRRIIKISRLVNRYNHVINANLNFRKISQNFGVRNACEAVLNRFIAKIDMFNMLSVNISV